MLATPNIDDSEPFFAPVSEWRVDHKPNQNHRKLGMVIGGSILLHCLVLLAFNHQPAQPVIPNKAKPVNAVLYFPPALPKEVETPTVSEQKREQQEPNEVQTRPQNVISERVSEPLTPPPPANKPSPEPEPTSIVEAQVSVPGDILTSTHPDAAPAIVTKPRLSSRDAIREFLSSDNVNKVNQQSLDAAQEYRRLQTSPILPERKLLSEDEIIQKKVIKQVNCESGLNQTLAVLSGVTGGNLRCSERSKDIDKFIEKHKK